MGDIILHVIRIDKLLFQFLPLLCIGFQRERVCQEVVGSGILIHTTDEVRDSIQEMLFLYHRGIEDHVVTQLLLGTPYVVSHTLEHLEAEAVLRRVIHLGEQVSVRDGKEVMRCHTDMQHLGILGFQAALDDMQIIGVHLCLVRTDRVRPSTKVTHDILHVEVTSLHDTHLDG